MSTLSPPVAVKVTGPYACFTRPEMKVERVTYETMTPSAARGVLEAIFWKPEFQWRVRQIDVLKPIRHWGLLRNEVSSVLSTRAVQGWEKNDSEVYFAEDDRTQRHTLALHDVAYVVHADVVLKPGVEEDPAKYRDQFRRRVARGQRFHQPYFGCREFTADFTEPSGNETPISVTASLGTMLFDIAYDPDKGRHRPIFFEASLEDGVLRVPPELYELREGMR
ncbi:MAG: type I-C CRISPR-associated protein Cas5c [Candidatus Poribacteria bacterium]|nr:type I-C CRISPR-associated protein Cas5c [Candidatus Poribacteria bacterium]